MTFDQIMGARQLDTMSTLFVESGRPGVAPQESGFFEFPDGARYLYNPQARTISVVNAPEAISFAAIDLDPAAPPNTIRFARANGQALSLVTPAPGGQALLWTRFLSHNTLNAPASTVLAVAGFPTPISNLPVSGTRIFTRNLVAGEAYIVETPADIAASTITRLSLDRSTLTASVNYTTDRITFALDIIGRPLNGGGADVRLITISGEVDFQGNAQALRYDSTITTQHDVFKIAAVLFGTGAAEAGGIFSYQGRSANNRSSVRFIGQLAAVADPRLRQ